MPIFEVQGPGGNVYEVDAPSQEAAQAALQNFKFPEAEPKREVIATTDDGGRVYQMPDGKLSFASPGYSTTDQDRIAEIMQGAKPVDLVQRDIDEERIAQNPVALRAQEFIQGTPFIGEYADEAVGLVSPEAAKQMRLGSDAFERQRPLEALGLNVAGGLVTTLPLLGAGAGAKGADFISKGTTLLDRSLRAAAIAAPAGAIEGAASFAGRAAEGERAAAAVEGAAVGGTLGAVLGPFANATGEAVGALARRIKSLDVNTIASEFGLSKEAARTVRSALQNDDITAAQTAIARLGDDAFLADAGPATGALLDASAATGGQALRVAREAVDARTVKASEQLTKVLDQTLGLPSGVKRQAREIAAKTSAARSAAYNKAYAQPIDYAAQSGRGIEAVLDRVPSGTMDRAIREANEAMQERGLRNLQIIARQGDDGVFTFDTLPNVQQLDFLKQALNQVAEQNVDNFGRKTAAGLRASRLAGDLRDAIVDAVPDYKAALRLGGDKLEQDQALRLGRDLLGRRVSVEDVQDAAARWKNSPEAQRAAAQGLREGIEETLSNVRRTISDPNVDAREAMQVVKDLSSRAAKEKVVAVIGQQKANKLFLELDRATAALELRAAISQNSKTAIRQSIQQQVSDETAPSLLRGIAGRAGNPFDAAQEITQTVAGIDPRTMSNQQKAIFDEIANALVSIRGQEAQQALLAVNRALQGQPIRDADAVLIGNVVGNALGVGSYQAGRTAQAPQPAR